MGQKVILRKDVVPHINITCKTEQQPTSQLTDSERKRKLDVVKNVKKMKLSSFKDYVTSSGITKPSKSSLPSSSSINSDPISSSSSLQVIDEDLFKMKDQNQYSINYPQLYLGMPKEEYYCLKLISEISQIHYVNIFITLRKIRLNDQYSRLAICFGKTTSTISEIFTDTVPKLSNMMQDLIYWPDKKNIKKSLPAPFRIRYNEVQSIVNCFEIEIQPPKNPVHFFLTWSLQKKANTIKYLISTTPNGFVNFVSEGFAGRTTDKGILETSGFVNKLPNNCCIMADRGFKNVEELLNEKNCKLIRPPTVTEDVKKTREQVMETKRIACLRINVERIIRRLREFNLLVGHSCINLRLIKLINHILIIACALINLQPSFLIMYE